MSEECSNDHIGNWRRETAEHAATLQDFLSWFDASRDPGENTMRGWWDFSFHILKPELIDLIGEPFDKVALEIGYGAGRLLVPACHYFKHCVGIDIHPFKEKTDELIREHGVSNFETLETDGCRIPLDESSIDVVYSFIVLQHLPDIGAAILYMGHLPGRFQNRHIDMSGQKVSTARQVTLRLTIPLARSMLKEVGFRVHDLKRSRKRPWSPEFGGQFYAIIER
jgi:hypothetical protein